jgi:hypothetical protein
MAVGTASTYIDPFSKAISDGSLKYLDALSVQYVIGRPVFCIIDNHPY